MFFDIRAPAGISETFRRLLLSIQEVFKKIPKFFSKFARSRAPSARFRHSRMLSKRQVSSPDAGAARKPRPELARRAKPAERCPGGVVVVGGGVVGGGGRVEGGRVRVALGAPLPCKL